MTAFSCEPLESRRHLTATVGLDPSFGTVVTHVRRGGMDIAMHGVALPHGRFLAYGLSVDYSATQGEEAVFALYDAHGQLVKSFGKNGLLIQDTATYQKFDFVNNLIALNDGSVLVDAGSGEHKLNLNGTFDTHFGNGGVLPKHAYSPKLLPDGAIQTMQTTVDPISKNVKTRLLTFNKHGQYMAESAFVSGTPQRLGNGQFVQLAKNNLTFYNADLTVNTHLGTKGTVGLTTAMSTWVAKHGPWYQNLTKLTTMPAFGAGSVAPTTDGGSAVYFSVAANRSPAAIGRGERLFIQLNATGGIVAVGLKPGQVQFAGVGFSGATDASTYGSFSFSHGAPVAVPATGAQHGYIASAVPAGDGSYYLLGQSYGDTAHGWGFEILHTRPLVGTITGTVFGDTNANGKLDSNEAVGVGKTVYLDANNNGKLDAGETTTTTNAQGLYAFTDLGPGTYVVRRVVPALYVQTTPVQTITLAVGQRASVLIGTRPRTATFA